MSGTGKKPARHVYKTGAAGCGGKAAPTSAKNAGQPLPCPFCDRIFKQDGRLKEHLKNKHADEENQESEESSQIEQPPPSTSEPVQNPQRDEHGYPIKSPKTLLHEWCQKNKKPQPKFKAVEVEGGGFQCRVILPDDKKSEADVILWYRREPTRTSMEAQHRASVMALHHVMGNRRLCGCSWHDCGGDIGCVLTSCSKALKSVDSRRSWIGKSTSLLLSDLLNTRCPRLDRILGEDYKQLWFDLDKAAEERKEYLKRHPPQPRHKPAPVQRELHSVFMSEGNRRLVEDIIRGSGVSDASTSIEQDSNVDGEMIEHHNENAANTWEDMTEPETSGQEIDHPQKHVFRKSVPARVQFKETKLLEKNSIRKTVDKRPDDLLPKDRLRSQLQRFGFKPHHVNAALAERDELSRALDWLVLHVPENELPPKFAAESSKMSVQVLVRGKQVPDRVQSTYASESVSHLQEYGYSDVDCIEALIEAKGDEVVALGSLFTTLMGKQGGDLRKNEDDGPPESIAEMREEELLVLQSIFEEEKMTLSEDSMIFNLSLEEIVDVTLNMEVRIPPGSHYPYEIPSLAFRSSELPSSFLLDLTRKVGEAASQMSGPMLYDLYSTATELARSLLPKYLSPGEDVAAGVDDQVWDHLPELEPGLGSEIFDKTTVRITETSRGSHSSESMDNPNGQSKVYIPPGLRKPQDIQGHVSSFQQAPDTGQEVRRNSRALGRSGMKMSRDRHEQHGSGGEEYNVDVADVRQESERLKEEWEAWQKSRRDSEIRGVRAKLPAYKFRSDLLQAINGSCVTIVCGQTGCGKSTQVPQYVLEDYIERNKGGECNIICTQPRRISAIGLADRVSKERGASQTGITVGYSVRLDTCRSKRTRLLFCTTGILLRRLLSDPNLIGVTHVIVDEVHERSLESDLLLLLLRQFLCRPQNSLRVILMSATVDAGLFANYFKQEGDYVPPIMNIPGFTFPVRELYLEDAFELTGYRVGRNSRYALRKKTAPEESPSTTASKPQASILTGDLDSWEDGLDDKEVPDCVGIESYNESTQQSLKIVDQSIINFELIESLVCSILQQEVDPSTKYGKLTASEDETERRDGRAVPSTSGQMDSMGAILVFLPGMLEIRKLQQRLQSSHQISALGLGGLSVLALHGSLSGEEQKRVFKKPPPGVRKVVLATNIAETSITIDDVVYVIDSGRHKEMRYDHNRGLSCLEDTWVAKANAKQRRGRAGRVRPGCCFRLFSRQQFEKFEEQQLPEMLRVSLEGLCLRVKTLLEGKVMEVVSQMLTPPSFEAVSTSLKSLEDLNALDKSERLTPLGQHLARMPVDARVGKMLIFGCMLKCLDPVLTIAASLSGRSPFMSPLEKRDEAAAARMRLAGNSKSDHMAIVAAHNGWASAKTDGWSSESDYCQANFLSRETLSGIEASRADYLKILVDLGFLPTVADYNVAGAHLNANANSVRVVKALICAGFYPNIVRVLHPEKTYVQTEGGAIVKTAAAHELRFFTKEDGRVFLHPSSVNFPVGIFESPWLVYTEKVKTSKVFLRESTMIPAYALLLFGGEIRVKHERQSITVDDWLQFEAPARIAVLIRELRLKVDSILLDKIQQPSVDISSSPVVTALIRLLTTDGF